MNTTEEGGSKQGYVPIEELEALVERMERPETFVSDHVSDEYIEGYNQADNDRADELQEVIETYE